MITVAIIFLAVFNFLLGLITLRRNPERAENISFFVFTTLIAVWILANYFENITRSASIADFLVRTDFAFGALLAASFLVFAASVSGEHKKLRKILILVVFAEALLAVLVYADQVFTSQIVAGGIQVSNAKLGELYDPLIIIPLLAGIGMLIYKRIKSKGIERQQASVMLYGLFVTVVWVAGANIIVPLITPNIEFQTSLQRLAYSGFLIFNIAVSYAIVRHKLFDIRLVVARSVTYLLSIVTIGALYGFVAFSLVDQIFFGGTSRSSLSQQLVYSLLAILLAFTFQPIRRFFEKVTDKIFFRDKYDAQLLINSIGRILSSEIELESLTTKVVHELKRQMHVDHADIIVIEDNDENIFFDAGHMNKTATLHRRDLVKLGNSVLVADNLTSGERKEIMARYNRAVASPLRANKQLIGYLFLGDKLSGDAYSAADIRFIKIIVNELAVAVQNAKSFTEIQRFNETLQDKVTEATRKLRKANEDLKSLDQAKDEFISMASHQLRTPLTTAKGYVSMVLEGDFGKLPTKIQPPLAQALDSTARMSGLINDLLNVSRMDAGKFFIDAVDVDLDLEVQGEVNQLANLAQAKNVTITYHPPKKKIPLINLDLDKTRQVIMNIADNAVHYSAPPSGGGKADVYLELEGDEAVFKVVDNGIGVPDEIKPKLFAKFFRAGNAQQARPDGTGLGLYLVKRVVEDQGGTIIFESEVGKGSTFGFRMPIHNKLKIDKEAAKRLENTQGKPAEPAAK